MQNLLSHTGYIKHGLMPGMNFNQLLYETHAWTRLLDYMSEENIHYKNRLSEILQDRFDKNLLEEADAFQNRFIRQDEMTGLLRHDVTTLKNLIYGDTIEKEKRNKKITTSITNLRKSMVTAEKQSGMLKADFNHFLLKNIL